MNGKAVFIRHKAKPGKRDALLRIWEKYACDYVAGSTAALTYCYSFDDRDPDVVLAFQLAPDEAGVQDFMRQAWFDDYQRETAALISEPSQIMVATALWAKNGA